MLNIQNMKKHYTTLILLLFLFGSSFGFSDSIFSVLDTAKAENRVNTLNTLCINTINIDPHKALEYSKEALEISIKLQYKRGMASSYNNLGVIFKNHGMYDKALDYYIKSIAINDSLNNIDGVAFSKNNIGTIYSAKLDFEKALKYYLESYEIIKKTNQQDKIVGSLSNIGNVYIEMGKFKKALDYFNESVKIYEKIGQKNKSFEPLNNLGNIYFHQEKYNQALDYYSLSLLIELESNNLSGQAYTQNNIGAAYFKLGNYPKAEEHQVKALNLALKIDGKPILKSIYKSLSETYYQQKRLDDAYQTLLKYDHVKDFVYNEESSRKLARLELAIELEEKEKEIEINQKENAISNLENKNNQSFIIIFMMGGILLMAFLFIVYSLRKDKKINIQR